ncbi:hypothetical protein [Cryptosporangium phraense]|uniref:Uncharacterized protein n=1 Tax=Cryptosporangium phraense TaxID=2593070 RepID=A0A545AZU8_9ACTN|nr:hypothetical protein [Cryptosporangium phraense]TQS46850.1 hypothetical protein FL583_00805 [Cryptosporangium phraense]
MTFESLFAEVAPDGRRFGHREHVHLTWLAVRAHGVGPAVDLIGDGIRSAAPSRYHVTMTRAWVELVGFHLGEEPSFEAFAARNPALLDTRLLTRFYSPATLDSPAARTGWVAPDREPFPWTDDTR